MKIDEISIWEAFYGVAKYGNFSKASKNLNIAVPQLSKRVARLEEHLGVRLFQRSTRVVTLTEEGNALLPRVSALLEDWSGMESFFEEKNQTLKGTIRITCIPFVAQRLLIPVLSEFTKLHPHIHVELELSEGMVNLVESNIDVAIRIHNEPPDSSLIYRKLFPNTMVACASPVYLKKHKTAIHKPKDLFEHDILALNIHNRCQFGESSVKVGDLKKSKKISCENGWFLTQLALNHFGIVIRSQWDVREYLKTKALVQVLKDYPLGEFGNIYAVTPSKRLLTPRVSTFLEFLQKRSFDEIKATS